MKKIKPKHVYKSWKELSEEERKIAQTQLKPFQLPTHCKYQFTSDGTLVGVLDYSALADIFSI